MKRYKDLFQPETNEGPLDYLLRSGSGLGAARGSDAVVKECPKCGAKTAKQAERTCCASDDCPMDRLRFIDDEGVTPPQPNDKVSEVAGQTETKP